MSSPISESRSAFVGLASSPPAPITCSQTHHALVEARNVIAQSLQRFERRKIRATLGHFGFLLGQNDGAFDELQIADAFPKLLLDVQETIGLYAARQRNRQRRHEFALGEAAHRRLMPGMALQPRAREHRVGQSDVAVQEYTLPRNYNIIENGDCVGFLETGAKRMIPFRLVAQVERLPTDKAQAGRIGRDGEGERIFFLAWTYRKGQRINQKLVGGGAVRRQHFGATNDEAVAGLFTIPK